MGWDSCPEPGSKGLLHQVGMSYASRRPHGRQDAVKETVCPCLTCARTVSEASLTSPPPSPRPVESPSPTEATPLLERPAQFYGGGASAAGILGLCNSGSRVGGIRRSSQGPGLRRCSPDWGRRLNPGCPHFPSEVHPELQPRQSFALRSTKGWAAFCSGVGVGEVGCIFWS